MNKGKISTLVLSAASVGQLFAYSILNVNYKELVNKKEAIGKIIDYKDLTTKVFGLVGNCSYYISKEKTYELLWDINEELNNKLRSINYFGAKSGSLTGEKTTNKTITEITDEIENLGCSTEG